MLFNSTSLSWKWNMGYWPSLWGQDGWILAKFFFFPPFCYCVFMDRNEVDVHKYAKKGRGYHPAISTEQACSMVKYFFLYIWEPKNDLRALERTPTTSALLTRLANKSAGLSFILPAQRNDCAYWHIYSLWTYQFWTALLILQSSVMLWKSDKMFAVVWWQYRTIFERYIFSTNNKVIESPRKWREFRDR